MSLTILFEIISDLQMLELNIGNGTWRATMTMGDRAALHDNMVVKAEGETINGGVRSYIDQFSYVGRGSSGDEIQTFDVAVSDGELNIELSDAGGNDPNWVLTRLSLEKVSDSTSPPVPPAPVTPVPTSTPIAPAECRGLSQEAELAQLGNRFVAVSDSQASGGQYIHAPDGTNNDFSVGSPSRATFCFNVLQAGRYKLVGRVDDGSDRFSNSFFVTVDGEPSSGILWEFPAAVNGFADVTVANRGEGDAEFDLSAGEHTVIVYLRGDGARLDKLTLVNISSPAPTPTPTPTPVPPTGGSSTYEAEDATIVGATIASGSGSSEGQYIDYINASGDYIEWTVNVSAGGSYQISIQYANGNSASRPMQLGINGSPVGNVPQFLSTGSWTTWTAERLTVNLNSGNNTIRLTANGSSGPNVDFLTVDEGNTQPPSGSPQPTFTHPDKSYDGVSGDTVAHSSALNVAANNSNFAVEYCIQPGQGPTGQWRAVAHKGQTNSQRTFAMWLRPNDMRLHYRISTTASGNSGGDSVAALVLNQLTKVTYVRDGNKLKLYLNGTLDSEATLGGTVLSNTGPLYIGDSPWYPGTKGQLGGFKVYDQAITPDAGGCSIVAPTTDWQQVAGGLVQVDALDYNQAVGVNANDWIYYRNGSSWTRISGSLKHVSYGEDGSIWGVNRNNQIYRRASLSGGWQRISDTLKQVAALDYNRAVGVNTSDQIFYYNGSGWTQISGRLKHVSYGEDGSIWGVNSGNAVYRRASLPGGWQRMAGSFKQVDALDYNRAVAVDSSDKIFYYDGDSWVEVSGSLKHVSYGKDVSMWGVDSGNLIYRK